MRLRRAPELFPDFRDEYAQYGLHDPGAVTLVYSQILRAAEKCAFVIVAYCFMPDHLHMLVTGNSDASNCKAFIKAAKQYSGYHFARQRDLRLWERYSHDRVIRDGIEFVTTIRYIVSNPVVARLVEHPRDYPFLGSQLYTVDELLEWCEYCAALVERNPPATDGLPPKGGSHELTEDLPPKGGSHGGGSHELTKNLPPEGGSHEAGT